MHDSIQNFLNATNGAGSVVAHARLLIRLQHLYGDMAPSYLGQASTVANYKQGVVVIHADNGAVAAKLRQMATTLADEFCKLGVECSGVQIRVQASQIPLPTRISPQRAISARAGGTLDDLSKKLPDSPLRDALKTLLDHALIDRKEDDNG